MSVSDPRGRQQEHVRPDEEARPLTALSERLARARQAGEPAPEELERLVGMLAQRAPETDDRLTKALEGLARWAETAKRVDSAEPAPAERRAPDVAPEIEARLTDFARTLTESPKPAPAPAAPARREAPPIASLRAALAEIAARQKTLDDEADASPPRAVLREEPRSPAAARPSIDPDVIAGMRSEIERLSRTIEELPRRSDLDGLTGEMVTLSRLLGEARPSGLDSGALKAIDALVTQVEQMRGEAASPQIINELAAELKAISARLDAIGPRSAEAVEALAQRIEEVRGELDHFPRASAVEELLAEIQSIVARLDRHESAAIPAREAVEGLTGQVEALDGKIDAIAETSRARADELERMNEAFRAELETRPRADAMSDLGRQIEALTEGLKARPPAAPSGPAFQDISGKLEIIDDKIEKIAAVARPEALDGIGRKIDTLAANLAARPSGTEPEAIGELVSKVDGLGERIDDMAAATRARGASFDRVEEAVRSIAEQLLGARPGEAQSSQALEEQIGRLVCGLERNDGRLDDLNAAMTGVAARIEQSCANLSAEAARAAADASRSALSGGAAGGEIAQALAELRSAASQAERRTADTLDAVRLTLERLLERMEDREPRGLAPAASAWTPPPAPEPERPRAVAEAPNASATEAARAAARRAMAELEAEAPGKQLAAPRVEPEAAPFRPIELDLDLAPDHPLEPGSAPHGRGEFAGQSSAAQTAASFIAAARRAAVQSAAEDEVAEATEIEEARASRLTGVLAALKARKRPILIGVGAALIVLAALYVASGMTGGEPELAPEPAPTSLSEPSSAAPADESSPAAAEPNAAEPAPAEPAPAEAPAEKRSELTPPAPEIAADKSASAPEADKPARIAAPRAPAADLTQYAFGTAGGAAAPKGAEAWKTADPAVTGSISRNADDLPPALGKSLLGSKAAAGDAAAQFELASRLLEGRGVAPDPTAAARWLEKSAAQGLAPAQHRLGSLYEKGTGVTRDVQTARRWYEQAAASGNVRAMHNLGVIHAEGGLGKPDYNAAVVWFRMAAERGLVDSEYNLAVLRARGLGGKRDLAEAYKWFALAAAQGDDDAARKRDDVAKALGAGLPAAKAAVDAFRPRPVDAAANTPPEPAGGWDQMAAKTAKR